MDWSPPPTMPGYKTVSDTFSCDESGMYKVNKGCNNVFSAGRCGINSAAVCPCNARRECPANCGCVGGTCCMPVTQPFLPQPSIFPQPSVIPPTYRTLIVTELAFRVLTNKLQNMPDALTAALQLGSASVDHVAMDLCASTRCAVPGLTFVRQVTHK